MFFEIANLTSDLKLDLKGDNILNVTIKKNMIAHYSSVVLIEINSRHRLIISYGEEGTIIMRKQSTFEVMNVYRVINDNIVSDICFNEDDLIYITLYDPTRMLFTIYGATINFLIFQKIKHSSFLPIQFENVKNEIAKGIENHLALISFHRCNCSAPCGYS